MAELTRLGRYQLKRVLGRGAMGVVYEGLDPALNRRVAVKTILRNAAIDAETAQHYSAQFAREAQAAGRLNHPNIVQVHDFAEEGDVAYLVMEYIQGRELRSFFEAKERFDIPEAVRIMGELLDALDFAHEAGVIHRDIKPANVMLDAQRRVKLADFGVARIQDSERSAAGTMVGTPAFMSPEQIQGLKIDRRTDIFSAGVVLYQLLTGEQPFTGQGAWTVAKKIMQDDPPRPSSVVTSVSPVFDEIVNKALAKTPPQRYASAREFASALRAAVAPANASLPPATPAMPAARPAPKAEAKASEAEVEFWRAIQNSTDAAEFEFYLEQFPEGTYAQLARHKVAKLREPQEAARKAAEEKARQEAEARARAAAEAKAREEAEAKARALAEAKARAEAEARRVAEEKARQDAARKAAEEKARQEAEARARAEAEAKARAEAEARRQAEEAARQAAALEKLRQQEQAAARAKAAMDEDATIAIGNTARPAPAAPAARPAPGPVPGRAAPTASVPAPGPAPKRSFAMPAAIGGAVIVAGIVGYVLVKPSRAPEPAPAPAAQTAPAKPPAEVVDVEKIRRETEEKLRREYEQKSAAERAALEKSLADKAAAEKTAAEKVAQAKTAAEKAAAEKAQAAAAAERAAAEKAAVEKAAAAKADAERQAAERAAAEKQAADKAAAEKAAAEKAAAEKAAAEKAAVAKAAAARKPGWPAVGDKWVYEAKDSNHPERRASFSVEVKAVSPSGITDATTRPNGAVVEVPHGGKPFLVGIAPGIVSFTPYLAAFQDLREGTRWSDIDYRNLFRCDSGFTCTARGGVVGREKVSVKAGSFDAAKIVLQVFAQGSFGQPTVIELRYWFAESANRVVKYELRTSSPNFSQPLMDLELVSYTRAGG